MKKEENLKIFDKYTNTNSKTMPFKLRKNDVGKTKYLPPYFKEWNNTAYFYNKNTIKNMPINNIIINKIITSYFNLIFLNTKNISIKEKRILFNKKRSLVKDIYLSNVKIKYTNSIAIITLYTLNLRKYIFTKYMKYLNYFSIRKEWEEVLNKNTSQKILIRKNPLALTKILKEKFLRFIGIKTIILKSNKDFKLTDLSTIKENNLENIKEIINFKFKFFNKGLESYNLYIKIYLIKQIKHMYSKYLYLLYKYNYQYFLNNLKFKNGNSSFIPKLKSKLSTILNKKIELNIINLKSLTYSPDIFTKALANKLKKKSFNVLKSMIAIINRGRILNFNVLEKEAFIKNKDLNLLENKYKDISLISTINNNNLNTFLKNTYTNDINNAIFNIIKYKNMNGIRLEVKGRLTKRFRADRAIYKLRWKGGLKNTDSSVKKLSSVMFRSNLKSNVVYSITRSKRRIGSFAVKGWISGK